MKATLSLLLVLIIIMVSSISVVAQTKASSSHQSIILEYFSGNSFLNLKDSTIIVSFEFTFSKKGNVIRTSINYFKDSTVENRVEKNYFKRLSKKTIGIPGKYEKAIQLVILHKIEHILKPKSEKVFSAQDILKGFDLVTRSLKQAQLIWVPEPIILFEEQAYY